jgi:hypothetical protein
MTADINIEKITLQLPDGFEQRAQNISTLIARHLGEMSFSKSHDVATMRLPNFQVDQLESDSAIAQRVSSAIAGQLENNPHKASSLQADGEGVNNA